jgi:hypothetical protein
MSNDDLLQDVSFRGGSRIGWVNASFPLARLTCSRARLALASLGTYEFTPDQVVSFGRYQRLALAPVHLLGEVRATLTLLQLVSGPMALAFGVAWYFGG